MLEWLTLWNGWNSSLSRTVLYASQTTVSELSAYAVEEYVYNYLESWH